MIFQLQYSRSVATAILGIIFLLISPGFTFAQNNEEVNHAEIIKSWNEDSYLSGKQIYTGYCYTCHGIDGTASLPTARSFNKEELKFGNDPYSMWKTMTKGVGQMMPQIQYTPEERYAVIQYIRENIIRKTNPEEYSWIGEDYLASLPKGSGDKKSEAVKGHARDFGPVLTSQFRREVNRAMTFNLGQDIYITYDLHRMRQHYLWEGYLNLSQTQHIRYRGERQPYPEGIMLEGLETYYWAFGDDFLPAPENSLMLGLEDGKSMGPTPPEYMVYHGHYLDGNAATISYSIKGRNVLERPRLHRRDDFILIENTIWLAPSETTVTLYVVSGEDANALGIVPINSSIYKSEVKNDVALDHMVLAGNELNGSIDKFSTAAVAGDVTGCQWQVTSDGKLCLHIDANDQDQTIRLLRYTGTGPDDLDKFRSYVNLIIQNGAATIPDLHSVKNGGKSRWNKIMITKGILDIPNTHYDPIEYRNEDADEFKAYRKVAMWANKPYVVDDLPLPVDNPWNAWMRMSALDFFNDGRLVAATLGGDIWIVSGIDENLDNIRWKRYATGMFEPLGVKVIDNLVYVTCRDAIIRLHDLNNDGEADYYEDFFTDPDVSNGFHAFNFDLDTDSEGNLYYTKPGRYTDYSQPGALMKISPNGKNAEVVARGFRVPNGLGIDAKTNTIYISGQEGNWVPASKITILPQNDSEMPWFGVSQTREKVIDTFVQPIIWMPREFDNSTGAELVPDDERFGPLNGHLMHVSFGKGWMYYHIQEEIDGIVQASAIALPFQFDAGLQRLRQNPHDGQVYAVGLTGWDAESTIRDGCLNRMRYTGNKAYLLKKTHVKANGVQLHFNFTLDKDYTENVTNYYVERWNYRWAPRYGSDHWSVKNPNKTGNDLVSVKKAVLSDDKQSVFLKMDDMQPVNQMLIRIDIRAEDATPYKESVYMTINKVRDK